MKALSVTSTSIGTVHLESFKRTRGFEQYKYICVCLPNAGCCTGTKQSGMCDVLSVLVMTVLIAGKNKMILLSSELAMTIGYMA